MDPTSKLKTDIICDFKPDTMSSLAQSRAGMRIVMTKSNIPKSLWKYYLDAPDTSEQCKQRQETNHCRVARCQFEIWVNQIKDNLKEEDCKFCCGAESGVLCEPDHGWLNLSCLSVEHLPFAWQWPLSLRQVIAKIQMRIISAKHAKQCLINFKKCIFNLERICKQID